MKRLLLGTFEKHEEADAAIVHLEQKGFESDAVSVITRQSIAGQYAPKEGHKGAVTGGVLGGLAGLLIAATPVVLPGAVLIAGPLTILTGAAIGAITGGILGALVISAFLKNLHEI